MKILPSIRVFLLLFCRISLNLGESDGENFERIEVDSPCQKEIKLFRMFTTSIHAGEVNIRWTQTRLRSESDPPCDLYFTGYYLYNRLAIQFHSVNLGSSDCLYVQEEGRYFDKTMSEVDDGYGAMCGSYVPVRRIFTTKAERNLVLRFELGSTGYKSIRVNFNVFHTNDECEDYLCENGRCIPEDIECNPNNPCGDNSECKNLTGWEIFGIVVGSIAGLIILCYCCCHCCRDSKKTIEGSGKNEGNIRNARTPQEVMPLNGEQPTEQRRGFNITPVYVYVPVSNQGDTYSPPIYSSTNVAGTEPSSTQHDPLSSGLPVRFTDLSATSEPSAPPVDFNEGPASPPSYDDVMAHGDKYKVT